MSLWMEVARQVSAATGEAFALASRRDAGGGCINSAVVLEGEDGRRYFVKLNDAARLSMFEAEAEGLEELAAARAVRVPRPICSGADEGTAYLVLEYLDLSGGGRDQELLGRQLAQLHRRTEPRFGWRRDNTIGSTPQINTPSDDWVEFWRRHRLGYQLALAARNGYGGALQRLGERLMQELPAFFTSYSPAASLLHGDLWGGNRGATAEGEPVIFDPTVYYGDRETDLAMTELFGGFSGRFYDAYREEWALDAGYSVRKTLYNLYHVLNHLNLFGGAYGAQAQRMMEALLSEIR